MGLLYSAIVGLLVGFIARALFRGDDSMGLLKTMLLGIGGGFVAGLLGRLVGWYPPGEGAGLIASVLGAMLLLWLFRKTGSHA
jgi:uncharacterized membrane protein YeaQ/YmgE (transglycosylase-associated protein family)